MKNRKICLLIISCIILFSNNASAVTRHWIGIVQGDWNNTLNWSANAGGLVPASVPGPGDIAIFDGGVLLGLRNGNCTIDIDVNVGRIEITSGYKGTISQGAHTITVTGEADFGGATFTGGSADITIGGTFNLSGTAFTSTSATMELDGDAAFTGGSFAHNNGWVKFKGAGSQTISGISPVFYDLEFVGTGYTYTISSTGNIGVVNSLNISGASSCILNSGALDVSGSSIVLTNTSSDGGGTSTINIIGATNQTISSSLAVNQSSLPSVTINKSGGTLFFPALITERGNWTYTAGTLDLTGNNSTVVFASPLGSGAFGITGSHTLNNVTFEGNSSNTATINTGTILTVAGTLSTTGSAAVFINTPVTGATAIRAEGNISISNTSPTGGGTGTLMIDGTGAQLFSGASPAGQGPMPYITIQKASGVLTLSGTLSESRNWTYSSGTVDATANSSTVVFGGNDLSVTSAGMNFYDVQFAANTSTLSNGLSVNHNLTISGTAILAAGSNTINLAGNWTDRGTAGFTEAASTVNLNGSSLQSISSPGGENFSNLIINNSGSGIQLMNNTAAGSGLTMTQGNINLNGNDLTLGSSPSNNGILSYTAGNVYGAGSFTRWFNATAIPDGSEAGLFPMGTVTDQRAFSVSDPSAGPTAGGTISLAYADAATNTATTYADGSSTITVRDDLDWTVTTGNGLSGGNYDLDVSGAGIGDIGSSLSDLRLTLANGVVGLPGANAGTISDPQINRTGLALADLSNSFYVAAANPINGLLPLTLVSFTATVSDTRVVLNWSASAETNNNYFIIQRSKDAVSWENLGKIAGIGTDDDEKSYSACDQMPYAGSSYYRLAAVDLNGKLSYSGIRAVVFGSQLSAASVYPNPAVDHINVLLPRKGRYEISLFDGNGRITGSPLSSSGGTAVLDISRMAPGVYFLRVNQGDSRETKTVIIGK